MEIPSRQEINPTPENIDEKDAVEHFLGKDLVEAEKLLGSNFGYYQEDLMWMGEKAFCYYARAAIAYLRSEESRGDTAVVDCAPGVFRFQLENDYVRQNPILLELWSVVDYVLKEWRKFAMPWQQRDKKDWALLLEELDRIRDKDG